MPELGPLTITARNQAQAEYLVRSRAEQRGVTVSKVNASEAGPGAWAVTLTVDDVALAAAALLDEDTQVFHIHRRTSGSGSSD
jgi:hypothetical protein